MRELIARKRRSLQDDILTGLLQAEDQGDTLTEEELIYLLIVAGYETTVPLINNSVVTLLKHPDQFGRLRETPP
jgi:cytochrome P450